MYTLTVENAYGEMLELTHNPRYTITSILGLSPADAQINMTRNAGFDGSTFNSSYVGERTISITMQINSPAEENRILLYKYFKTKSPVKLHYKNGLRDVHIEGFVQSEPIQMFDKKPRETAQITILCPQPYFIGVDEDIQNFSGTDPLFEFPFSIEAEGIPFSEIVVLQEQDIINYGDVEVGCVFEIHAIGNVSYPKIYNSITQEHLFVNQNFVSGDTIKINTIRGQKSIWLLDHNNVRTNIIGKFVQGSTWLQLAPGDNLFIVDANSHPENMVVTVKTINHYEGV